MLRWTDPIIVKQDKKTAKITGTFLIPWGLVCFSCWLRVKISDRRDRSQYEDCLYRGNPFFLEISQAQVLTQLRSNAEGFEFDFISISLLL